MSSTLYPKPQAEFSDWLKTLANAVASDPEAAGVTQAQSDRLSDANAQFQAAYAVTNDPKTRTRSAVLAKLGAMAEAKREAKNIADIMRAAPGMDEAKLSRYGIAARGKRSVGKVPTERVHLQVSSAGPTSVRIRTFDHAKANNRKPENAIGVVILYHLGETAPSDSREWKLGGMTSKSTCELELGERVAPGTMVWVMAFYVNRKLQRGPMPMIPVQIRVAGSTAMAREMPVKIAA